MPARNVNLTDRLVAFVDGQVRNGRHQNASEVVREALRRYEAALAADAGTAEAIRTAMYETIAEGKLADLTHPASVDALLSRLTRDLSVGSGT